jgi:hypothetical protein
MTALIRLLILAAVVCLAADAGHLVDGPTSVFQPATFTTAWRLWQFPFCALILLHSRAGVRYLRTLIPFGLFFLWVLCSAAHAGFDTLTIKGMADLLLPYFVTTLLVGWIYDHDQLRYFRSCLWIAFWVIVAGAFALGLAGLQAIPGTSDPTPGSQLCYFAGVGNPISFVALSACLLAMVLAEAPFHRPRWALIRTLVILTPCTLALYRTALGGMIGAVLLMIAVFGIRAFRSLDPMVQRYNRRLAVGLGCLVLFGAVAAAPLVAAKMFNGDGRVNFSGRTSVWPVYLAAARDHLFWGLGPNGDVRISTETALVANAGEAHSDYLMLLVCYGIPGVVLWTGGIAIVVTRTLRLSVQEPVDGVVRWGAILSLVALGITMTVENIIRGTSAAWMYLFFPLLANLHSMARRDALLEEARLCASLPVELGEAQSGELAWAPE